MVPIEIQTGEPPEPGRYVVWTPCAALQVREWCEPSIASFHDGRWHSYEPVWGWIGPLPVVPGNDSGAYRQARDAAISAVVAKENEWEYDL